MAGEAATQEDPDAAAHPDPTEAAAQEDPDAAAHADPAAAATEEEAEEAASQRLGAHIRRLRLARGLTLVRLAAATDLSHPFLSQLERGLAQPSLSTLRRLAMALETSPIELIAAAEPPVHRLAVEVHRHGEGAIDDAFAAGAARMLASGSRPLHPLEMESCNTDPGPFFVHAEDEFLYVLEGRVRVELGDEEFTLSPGDSSYYAGGVPHRWWSADGGRYRALVVKQGLAARRA